MDDPFSDIDNISIFGKTETTESGNILLDKQDVAIKKLNNNFDIYIRGPNEFIKRNLLEKLKNDIVTYRDANDLPTFGKELEEKINKYLQQKKLKYTGETGFKGGKKTKRKSRKSRKSRKLRKSRKSRKSQK